MPLRARHPVFSARSKTLKVIDISEFYSERGGGIRSHLEVRGQFLCKLGHDHVVIAPGPRNEETIKNASNAPGGSARVVRLRGRSLPYDRTYHLLAHFHKIRLRVRAERTDVIEAHSPYLGAAAVLACGRDAAPVRTAFWHADHIGTYVVPAMAGFGTSFTEHVTRPLWSVVRTLLAPFDATFVAGIAQADGLRKAGVRDVVLAPFGVDVGTFHPGQRSETRRRELLAGGEGPLVVAVGRLAFEKRWDVLLAAFERVSAAYPGAVLVFFGDGPERARLAARAPRNVRFAGFERDRTALARSLASADVLAHACPYETFGLGVAEAVACGLPVVVPDAGGAASCADASTGVLYPSLDAAACAEGLLRVVRRAEREGYDARVRALAAAARVRTAEDHVRDVVSEYERLLHARKAGQSVRS
jgi:alpha-1,6-mannosyltransferase